MQMISPKCNVVEIPREWEKAHLELNDEAKLIAEPDGAIAVHVRRKPRLLPMLFKGKFRRLGRLDPRVEPLVHPLLKEETPLRIRLVDVPAVFLRMRQRELSFAVSIWAAVGPRVNRTPAPVLISSTSGTQVPAWKTQAASADNSDTAALRQNLPSGPLAT